MNKPSAIENYNISKIRKGLTDALNVMKFISLPSSLMITAGHIARQPNEVLRILSHCNKTIQQLTRTDNRFTNFA